MIYPPSYYQTQVDSLHNNWVTTLRDLRIVTEPSAKEMLVGELRAIYDQTRNLVAQHGSHIDAIRSVKLNHILQRPLEGHIAIARHNDTTVVGYTKQT